MNVKSEAKVAKQLSWRVMVIKLNIEQRNQVEESAFQTQKGVMQSRGKKEVTFVRYCD